MAVSERLSATARWVWHAPAVGARASRWTLLPLAALFRGIVTARNVAYDIGLKSRAPLPVPSIGVGNLSVGGTGKTPLAIHLARELERRGVRPGILLRGYGGDELIEHRASVPNAVVEAGADRHEAARRAVAAGAQALVLDDCLQRRDVMVDVMIAVVGAESWSLPRWPLPSGPWREGAAALRRADLVVVTRKLADQDPSRRLAAELAPRTRLGENAVAHLALGPLEPLNGGPPVLPAALRGHVVTALCGVGEPDLFAGQLERAGAWVDLLAYPDHHAFTPGLVASIAEQARLQGRWVVTTVKDAVKLMDLWPKTGAPCYVARLAVTITAGAEALARAVDRVATAARAPTPGMAAAPSTSER